MAVFEQLQETFFTHVSLTLTEIPHKVLKLHQVNFAVIIWVKYL